MVKNIKVVNELSWVNKFLYFFTVFKIVYLYCKIRDKLHTEYALPSEVVIKINKIGKTWFNPNTRNINIIAGFANYDKKTNQYYICVNPDIKYITSLNIDKDIIAIFAHEFAHIEQLYLNKMIMISDDIVFWRDTADMEVDDVGNHIFTYSDTEYDKRPWEIEAYKREKEFMMKYFSHFYS